MNRSAFTIIELLVVVAIAALLAGMVVTVGPRQSRGPSVQLAAEQTAAMLRRARAMAIAEQSPFTVFFNIQNAPGSSGRVINNRSGGHWCRIARSAHMPDGSTDTPPLITKETYPYPKGSVPMTPSAGGVSTFSDRTANGGWDYLEASGCTLSTFANIVEDIRSGWVSERLELPAGKARFLALGDSDEGPRLFMESGNTPIGYAYGDYYPRPYFGFFDPAKQRLFPWGGYDPDLSTAHPVAASAGALPASDMYTGLFYQSCNETTAAAVEQLKQSLNPADRTYQVDWNGDGVIQPDNKPDATRGPEGKWYLLKAAEVRPLINGEWGDFGIVFKANGTAEFPPMKCNRRWYAWDNGSKSRERQSTNYANTWLAGGCGASDMTKNWSYHSKRPILPA